MSELIDKQCGRTTIRWKLLGGASALALISYTLSVDIALAADGGNALVWLEVGGQFDQLSNSQDNWIPDFAAGHYGGPLSGSYPDYQRRPKIGFDADASLLFQPESSDWQIFAAIRIGKSRQNGRVEKHAHILPVYFGNYGAGNYERLTGEYPSFYNGRSNAKEDHQFIDFQAGREVGIGSTKITIRGGVRIAQLKSSSDLHVSSAFPYTYRGSAFNHAENQISRKFQGIGPSIALDGTVPMVGGLHDGQLTLDWNGNAALLFGRQTTQQKMDGVYTQAFRVPYQIPAEYVGYRQTAQSESLRKRHVAVPDLGASIGISYRVESAKVSLGYRAEVLFGVLDGGVAGYRDVNRAFYGPYASFSIGLGG